MIAIDTNVLVYRFDYNEPVKQQQSIHLLRQLAFDKETLMPWQVLGEFLRQATRWQQEGKITTVEKRDYLRIVRSTFPVSLPSEGIIDRALDLFDRYSLSHWDSMLLAACLEANVDTLYTEDMGAPRQIDSIRLVNPF